MNRRFLPASALLLLFVLAGAGCTTQSVKSGEAQDATLATVAAGIDRDLLAVRESNAAMARELAVTGLSGQAAEKLLSDHYLAHPWAISSAAVSNASVLVAIAPEEYRDVTGTDLSMQEETSKIVRGRRPLVSPVFPIVEGIDAIVQSCPVFGPDGSYLGYADLTYRPEVLIGRTAGPATNGTPCRVLAVQADGTVLYDPDPGATGQNVFTSPRYQDPAIQAFLALVAKEPSGSGTYRNGTGGMAASWATAGIDGAVWRVVVRYPASVSSRSCCDPVAV